MQYKHLFLYLQLYISISLDRSLFFFIVYLVKHKTLILAFPHHRMDNHRCPIAAHRVRHVIMEITLNRPHEPLLARKDLRRQPTIATLLHFQEIRRLKAGLCVPQVYLVQSFVAQKQRGTVVRAQQDHRLPVRFGPNVHHRSRTDTFAQVLRLDREQSRRSQVRKVQHGGAAWFANQRNVQHVVLGAARHDCSGQQDAVHFAERAVND